jgi:hypothetical protein
VLTVQGWQTRDGSHDFEAVEEGGAVGPDEGAPTRGGTAAEGRPPSPEAPAGGESAAAAAQCSSAEEGLGRGYG